MFSKTVIHEKKPKALVLTGFGINCEEEMAAACRYAGADAHIVHLNHVFQGHVSIHNYDVLNLPGGFSFGDDLGSAKVLANQLKVRHLASGKPFMEEILQFLHEGKYILGVCNGFQTLVKMGLLPNTGGNYEQEATLTFNDSGKFEDRWVTCAILPSNPTPFLNKMDQIDLPVRHGEGKLIFKDDSIRKEVIRQKLNVLTYIDRDGHPTDRYPWNPNGSELNCAGLCDPTGHVFGLMPHPEAYSMLYNHPDWNWMRKRGMIYHDNGEGLKIFRNIVETVMVRNYKIS
ncbi:MAG: phosphoribosylformylglycinamidine synthase subunit PurQ [Candidatus Marinimicrobia bacterium]|nr:phosphoribosylformylglycinamidine synthase subunit PurQ [Candidatus Neomarinimicrobiota bacterium]